MKEPDQITLFDYLTLVASSLSRKALPARAASVVIVVALSGKGTTGTKCVVEETRLAAELDVSRSTVWRQVEWLVEHGWLEQTEKPTRGQNGHTGRRARYRILTPPIDLGVTGLRVAPTPVATQHETSPNRIAQ